MYKTGILLWGSPGTGKTSLVKAIASKYNRSIAALNVSNLKNTYIEIEELYSGINPNSIFSAQNINHKDLSEINEIIKEYKDKSQNCLDKLEKLVAEESISENINNKSFSSREKYYKDLYNTVMLSDAMK